MLLSQLNKKKRFAKYLKKSESKNFLPSKRLLIKLVYLLISHHLIPACLATGRPQTVEVDYAEGQSDKHCLNHSSTRQRSWLVTH